jgi:hypothetical protein
MIRKFLSLTIFFSLTAFLFPQSGQKVYLDSLFNTYVKMKTGKSFSNMPNTSNITSPAEKCGFLLNASIRLNYNNFSDEQRRILNELYVRPDLQKSIVSPYGHFRIHFDSTGSNAPSYDGNPNVNKLINDIAQILDSVYNFEVVYLGYSAPPSDNGLGGDDLYDIYLTQQPSGQYGATNFETDLGNGLWSSYQELDNSFSGNIYYTHGINAAKVTIAHEFHHAIQIGNYGIWFTGTSVKDQYFYEMTSTAMEEFVFTDVNDYYQYLRLYFNNPQKSFTQYNPKDEIYALSIWDIYLRQLFGNNGFEIIKRQWELLRGNGALTAINLSLAENQTTFKYQLYIFGIWCYYTGYRKIDGKYFEEGKNYPLIKPTYKMDFAPPEKTWTLSTSALSNSYIRILGNNGTYIDTIYSIISNGDFNTGLNAPTTDQQVQFSLLNYNAAGSKHIANNYYSELAGTDISNFLEADIFNNNLSSDTNITYASIDYAFPNPFRSGVNNKLFLPVEFSQDKRASFNIYSVDMNLVASGVEEIITLFDKFVIPWNPGNIKLPTGVYIYVTDSANKIKKGKIVILNE